MKIPLLLFPIAAVKTCLFAKPLLSNGCCIFSYLAVVTQRRFYVQDYYLENNGSVYTRILYLKSFYQNISIQNGIFFLYLEVEWYLATSFLSNHVIRISFTKNLSSCLALALMSPNSN
jgi:hypothetical protein